MANTPKTVSSGSNGPDNNNQSMQRLKESAVYIIGAIIIALIAFFGWNYLQKSGNSVDTVAADKYAKIEMENDSLKLIQDTDPNTPIDDDALTELNTNIDNLVAEHGSTIYAWNALMIKARNAADIKDFDKALKALETANAINLNDAGLQAITQLRYAAILLANGNIEEAEKQASKEIPTAFEGSQQELLADIYMAKNDKDSAIRAYENAWSILSKRSEERGVLRLKLESLGVIPEPIEQNAQIVSVPPAQPVNNDDLEADIAEDANNENENENENETESESEPDETNNTEEGTVVES